MDFVVAGIVIGGLLVACGVFVRDLGPRLLSGPLRRDGADYLDPRTDPTWRRYCIAIGSLITIGGLLMVLAAVLGIVFDVSDGTGSRMVMLAGVVALGCGLLAALVVTPHYRRGGFEHRAIDELVESAKPIPAPFISVPADDLFAPDPAVMTLSSEVTEVVEPPQTVLASEGLTLAADVPDPATNSIASSEPQSRATSDLIEMAADSESQATELAESKRFEPASIPIVPATPALPPLPEPRPIAASQQLYERASNLRSAPTPVPDPSAYLIDLDDELPAWNAPVPVSEPKPTPAPVAPVVTSVPVRPGPPATPGGFQSSLLADLTESPDEPEDLTGTFKSRLLNELTRVPTTPAEPTVDVLLDEFPVPPDETPDNRGSGSTR